MMAGPKLNRRQAAALTAAALVPGTAQAKIPAGLTQVSAIPGGVRLSQGDSDIAITLSVSGIVSVVKAAGTWRGDRDGFFLKDVTHAKTRLKRAGHTTVLSGAGREVVIDLKAGTFDIRYGGTVITDLGGAPVAPGGTLQQGFRIPVDGPLLGLGQFRDPVTNHRNRAIYLAHANMDAVVPLLVNPPAKGRSAWGLLWDTGTHAWFDNRDDRLDYTVPDGVLVRYHVFTGDGLDDVIAAFRRLTGRVPLLGKWAYGFWQSQLGYWKQGDLIDVIDGYRRRGLPLDLIVQDATYWGSGDRWFPNWSGMTWDAQDFPDPKSMTAHAHGNNVKVIASIWPCAGTATALYQELNDAGLLFRGETWSGGKVLDITSPKARDIYWRRIKDGMYGAGLDGIWTDANEPEFMTAGTRYATARNYMSNGDCAAGPIRDHLLTYSYYQTRMLYDGARAAFPDRRPLTLTRKSHAGQQAFNTVLWSGDLTASWQALADQAINLQHVALTGLPYWTNDSGGFFVISRFPDGPKDPAYRELYVRWFQFSAWLPVFRAHGTDIRRELWAFGEAGDPAYDAMKAALEQRYALMPYIYSQAAKVTFDNAPFVRPPVMDFGNDPRISDYPAQFLFGRDLLVAPVTTPFDASPRDAKDFVRNDALKGPLQGVVRLDYFDGTDFETLVDSQATDALAIGWQGDLPAAIRKKPYSVRFSGEIVAAETGIYNITVSCQGATRIVIGGEEKLSLAGPDPRAMDGIDLTNPINAPPAPAVSHFDLTLEAGRTYPFEITKVQPVAGLAGFDLQWQTPAQRANHALSPDKTMVVYLPSGGDWYPWGSADRLAGGQTLNLRPILAELPVYVRAGAILPLSPGIQYAQQPVDRLLVHIYGGADGAFDLYDDEGDGHGYEQGRFSRRRLAWDDRRRSLTVGAAEGHWASPLKGLDVTLFADGGTTTMTLELEPGRRHVLQFGGGRRG